MTAILTEIAIQLKGSLSFVLGLGAFYSLTRSALLALIGLPKLDEEGARGRHTLKDAVNHLRVQILVITGGMFASFCASAWIYFGALGALDDKKLRSGESVLSPYQQNCIIGLVVIAILFVAADAYLAVRKSKLSNLIANN